MPNTSTSGSIFHTENPPLISQSHVPRDKPQPLPGKSAMQELLLFAVIFIIFVGTLAVVLKYLQSSQMSPVYFGVLLGLTLLASIGVMLLLYETYWRTARRFYDELDAGYVTLQMSFGGFGVNRRPMKSSLAGVDWQLRTPWNYRGIWLLDGVSGRVKQQPDFTVVAPGFYASPVRPGEQELWTGSVWAGVFRNVPAAEE